MKTVIEMAGQAFETPGTEPAFRNGFWTVTQEELERFAELVRADERQRLHEKFMEIHKSQQHSNNYWHFAARKIKEQE